MSFDIALPRGVCVSTCVFTEVFQPFNTLKPYAKGLPMNLTYISELDQVQLAECVRGLRCALLSHRRNGKKGDHKAPDTDLGDPRVTIDRIQQIL